MIEQTFKKVVRGPNGTSAELIVEADCEAGRSRYRIPLFEVVSKWFKVGDKAIDSGTAEALRIMRERQGIK